MARKIMTCCFFCLVGFTLNAQLLPNWSSFYETSFSLNPALTAKWSRTETSITHRMDGSGIDGAPVTTTLSYQHPFLAPFTKNAIGAFLQYDAIGATKTYRGQVTYNYRIRPQLLGNAKDCLSFGLGAGLKAFQFNPFGQVAFDGVFGDIQLQAFQSNYNPEISLGAFYSTTSDMFEFKSHFYAGLALHRFIPTNEDLKVFGKINSVIQTMVHGGYRIVPFRSSYYLEPQIFLSYGWYKSFHVMAAFRAEWENLFWVGAGVGSSTEAFVQLGYIINNQSKLGWLVKDGQLRIGAKIDKQVAGLGSYIGYGMELYAAYTFDLDLYQ